MPENTDAIATSDEIPANVRPYIETPEDTAEKLAAEETRQRLAELGAFPRRYAIMTAPDAEDLPVYDSQADAIRYQGRMFVPAEETRSLDMLQNVFEGQAYFQGLLGQDYARMNTQELANYIKDQVLALLDEGHEVLAEVSWKPWAKDQFVNHKEAGGEAADILCFLVNICLAVGLDAQTFYSLWREKATRNIARQEKAGGYSQVDGKCPTCRRAIDDLKAKGISTGNFGGVDFCDQPECITAYRTNNMEHANPAGTSTFGEN